MAERSIMNRFSIKDIENLTGIKAHTLRIWEQRYGIINPKRTETNIRYFDALDLKHILRISLLNKYGYKISKIQKMTDEEMNSLIQKIEDKDFRLQAIVHKLIEATLDLDTQTFEKLLNNYIKRNGIESTIEMLIFSYLEKIGVMWMTDRLFPAQEHVVSNIIYRKIALAIEKVSNLNKEDSETSFLLFLPEGELHDIALMYVYYLLCKKQKDVLYLGPNTPLKDIQLVYDLKKPTHLYTHLTSTSDSFDILRYLQKLSSITPDSDILISGSMLASNKYIPTNEKMLFLYNLSEVKEKLSTI